MNYKNEESARGRLINDDDVIENLERLLRLSEERAAAYESTLQVMVTNRGGFLTGGACQDMARACLERWKK